MESIPRFFSPPTAHYFLFGPRGTGKSTWLRNFYWRTKSGNEVDFVVYGEDGLWAIEIKHATTIHPKDLRGLRAFSKDYPEARCLLVYRGSETLQLGDILCLPAQQFLRDLKPGLPIIHP